MSTPPRPARRLLLAATAIFGALALAGCGADLPATTLRPLGDHAQRIYDLMLPFFWAALGVFVVVEGMLIYTVLRFKRREGAAIPAQVHGNTQIEVLWTVVPALIVLVIAVLTFRTQALNAVQPPDALKVTATGHQWWYEFTYPESGVVTANDMYIPVGRQVTVELEAKDVIHSFWVPKLAGKTDMIPGVTNRLTFKAEKTGTYYAHCSVLCGESHANMAFRVIVVPEDAYQRWLAAQQSPPAPPEGAAANGRQVFVKKACWACHVVAGVPESDKGAKNAPNLTYFGSRTTIAAGLMPNTPENLARWLRDPGAIKPGNLMAGQVRPGYLTEQEIQDLVAYLNSMKTPVDAPALAGK